MRMFSLVAAIFSLAATSTALNAQSGSSRPAAKKADPNEIVCERQKIPGTRLASAKVCKTRAEWAELRAQDRMDLERAQTQRGTAPQ